MSATLRLLLIAAAMNPICEGNSAADPPEAPAPRPATEKPQCNLLVGKWKTVEFLGRRLPPEIDITTEFTKEGKYFMRSSDPKFGKRAYEGTYTLSGASIRITRPTGVGKQEESWDVAIESITEKELVIVAGPARDRQRTIHERIEQN